MGKKGQVTIFVIVGMVVILIFALIYSYSGDLAKISLGSKNTQTRISEIFDAIKNDQMDKCIEKRN